MSMIDAIKALADARLHDLFDRTERFTVVANGLEAVEDFVREQARASNHRPASPKAARV